MNLINRIIDKIPAVRALKNENVSLKRTIRDKHYAGAGASRLTDDWNVSNLSSDSALRFNLYTLRARCRNLADNDSYTRKFLKLLGINVVGQEGVLLKNRAEDTPGILDKRANTLIENAWWEWGKAPTVCGQLNWIDTQRLIISTIARDGEILVRLVRGYNNKYRFAIQLLEADHLDINYNVNLSNGNQIRMGVEVDSWGKPVAYHIFTHNPADMYFNSTEMKRERIPADEILHLYIKERPSQSRGIPWLVTAMLDLHMLKGYKEAEVVAARMAACQTAAIIEPAIDKDSEAGGFTGEQELSEPDINLDMMPGKMLPLPSGYDFKPYNPTHPNTTFPEFTKAILRGACAGMGASYNSVSSDLESVNYSSLRQGALDDRDNWRVIQSWLVYNFIEKVFCAWLDMALLSQAIPLPITKYDKFNNPFFYARSWNWVDPQKDINAIILALNAGIKSRTMVAAEMGLDINDLLTEIAQENKLMKEMGIVPQAVDKLAATLLLQESKEDKDEDEKRYYQ